MKPAPAPWGEASAGGWAMGGGRGALGEGNPNAQSLYPYFSTGLRTAEKLPRAMPPKSADPLMDASAMVPE